MAKEGQKKQVAKPELVKSQAPSVTKEMVAKQSQISKDKPKIDYKNKPGVKYREEVKEVWPTPDESLVKLYDAICKADYTNIKVKQHKAGNDNFIEINDKLTIRAIDGKFFETLNTVEKVTIPKMTEVSILSYLQAHYPAYIIAMELKKLKPEQQGFFTVAFNHVLAENGVKNCHLIQ